MKWGEVGVRGWGLGARGGGAGGGVGVGGENGLRS